VTDNTESFKLMPCQRNLHRLLSEQKTMSSR